MKNTLITLSAFLCLSLPLHAIAEENESETSVERIRVTGSMLTKDLSSLPASVFVVEQETLLQRETRHLQDVLASMPNVNFSAGATRGKFVQIRGIGERSQFSEPVNPSVGLLLDDLDISGLGSLATIFDIQQVELLSGPRSVSSGLNSLAGIVKLVSNPVDAPSHFRASIAQYGEWQLAGAGSVAIHEDTALRLSVQQTQANGFVDNAFLNRDDTNGVDEFNASLHLQHQLSEQGLVSLKYYRFDIDNGYDAFSLDNNNVTLSDQPGFDKTKADALNLKYSHDLQDKVLDISVSQLNGDFDYAYDEDWTFTGFHPFGYTSFDRYFRQVERTNAHLKLGSNYLAPQPWLVGLSYYRNKEDLLREYTFNSGNFSSVYDPRSVSIYGHYEWSIQDKLRLVGAARVESFSADYMDNDGFAESLDDTLVAGSLSLQYELSESLFHIGLSRGYKAGGFNIDQRLRGDNRTFAPEYNWNAEVGIRGQTLDGKANIAVNVFYMRRQDAQVNDFATFEQVTEDGTVVTSFADAIQNADTGTNQGIELSSQWFIAPEWTVTINAGYLDAYFGGYERLDKSVVPTQDQAQAPEFTFYLSSDYDVSERLSFFIDVEAKDDYRFSDGHDVRAPFTVIANAKVNYQIGQGELSIWLKNVFDREIYTRGFGGFSNDPRDEYAFNEPYFQFGQERQLGATYHYQF